MGGALARGLLRRAKPPTGVWSYCPADPGESHRNLSLIFVSHPRGAVHSSVTKYAVSGGYGGGTLPKCRSELMRSDRPALRPAGLSNPSLRDKSAIASVKKPLRDAVDGYAHAGAGERRCGRHRCRSAENHGVDRSRPHGLGHDAADFHRWTFELRKFPARHINFPARAKKIPCYVVWGISL